MIDILSEKWISDKIKIPKGEVDEPERFGDNIENIEFEHLHSDEFDIPPTYVFRVSVKLDDLV